MKSLVLVAALLATSALAAGDVAVSFRNLTFDAAAKAAQAENKLVLIDFYTTWCGPCKLLDKETWSDAAVGKLVDEKAVSLKLDAEKEGAALAKKYGVEAYPTVLLVKPDGTELDRLVGFMPPADFIPAFTEGAKGNNAVKRAEAAVAKVQEDAAKAKSEEAVEARMKLAREFSTAGRNEEALREYLWLFDDGMKAMPQYSGVRVSFLTSDLGRLGKKYPPAADAIRERRDAAKARMIADARDREAASEFAALSEALGENAAILAGFNELPAGDPRRRALGFRVFKELVSQQRYSDALEARPFSLMLMLLNQVDQRSGGSVSNEARQQLRAFLLDSAATDLEVLVGAGKLDDARNLRTKMLEMDGSDAMKAKMAERVARTGKPDALDAK